MTTTIDTGGPAFPKPNSAGILGIHDLAQEGMTLRDYFAAKALGGVAHISHLYTTEDIMARACYRFADAMLRARKEGERG